MVFLSKQRSVALKRLVNEYKNIEGRLKRLEYGLVRRAHAAIVQAAAENKVHSKSRKYKGFRYDPMAVDTPWRRSGGSGYDIIIHLEDYGSHIRRGIFAGRRAQGPRFRINLRGCPCLSATSSEATLPAWEAWDDKVENFDRFLRLFCTQVRNWTIKEELAGQESARKKRLRSPRRLF